MGSKKKTGDQWSLLQAPRNTPGRSTGLPRQCAHWLAMTHLFWNRCCGGCGEWKNSCKLYKWCFTFER